MPEKKVIFADFATVKYGTIQQWLRKNEIEADAVTDPPAFLSKIKESSFDVCVVNLMLGGAEPFALIERIRGATANKDMKLIVVSRQAQKLNIQNSIRSGANDFVAEPFENENLYQRILYHLSPKQVMDVAGYEGAEPGTSSPPYLNLLLEATELMCRAEKGKEHATFLTILKRLADLLESNRSSLIVVEPESNTGVVLATSDDPNFYDFPISLHKYPEILHVIHTGQFVLIEDVSQNALTHRITEKVRTILIGSLMVFPVRFQGEIVGVLTIRRPRATEPPTMDVLRILQSLANTMAAHSNVKALLRKQFKDPSAASPGKSIG